MGALEVCPFCRHFNRKRTAVFLLKYLSPVITLVGLCILLRLGAIRGHARVAVKDLDRRQNFAQVELTGRIADNPRYYPGEVSTRPGMGTLEFPLDDGTGLIDVRSYEDTTADLAREGRIPVIGDRITLRGTYQFRVKDDYLIVGSAAGIEIAPPAPGDTIALSDLLAAGRREVEGRTVKVQGRVESVNSGRYEHEVVLADSAGSTIQLSLPRELVRLFSSLAGGTGDWEGRPAPGDPVEAVGVVEWDEYDRTLVITVGRPDRVRRLSREAGP